MITEEMIGQINESWKIKQKRVIVKSRLRQSFLQDSNYTFTICTANRPLYIKYIIKFVNKKTVESI